MVGRPMLQNLSAAIERAGGDSVILDRIADGESMQRIADSWKCSRGLLYVWTRSGGESRDAAFKASRMASADAHVEKAFEVLDDVPTNAMPSEVTLANSKSGLHKWLAGVRNKEEYGDVKQAPVQVNLTLGDFHIAALRAANVLPALLPIPADKTLDAEIIGTSE